jgi:alkyldihydroxyacetonephosphate synthase
MKTLTALGGGIAHIRNDQWRQRMQEINALHPVRPLSQYVHTLLKAILLKLFTFPSLWGLLAALCSCLGIDFDKSIIGGVRGFPDKDSFRQRPSLPLLRLLRRRLDENHEASLEQGHSTYSSLAARKAVAERVAARLKEGGVEVLPFKAGDDIATWWLFPMLDHNPKELVSSLWKRGFDATCTSTQLTAISSSPGSRAAAAMKQVVYLPVSPQMSLSDADDMATAVIDARRGSSASLDADVHKAPADKHSQRLAKRGSQQALLVFFAAVVMAVRPSIFLSVLPSVRCVAFLAVAIAVITTICIIVARYCAAAPELTIDDELLNSITPKPRPCGRSYYRAPIPISEERFDGAIILTGATGFLGGATLFTLLVRAKELGISKIVVIVRRKAGLSVQHRIAELRDTAAFSEVKDLFDELVRPVEGDLTQPGWVDQQSQQWPHEEPLRAVLHCAADVRFDQALQQAAVSSITASLQAAQVAARWGASRFVYCSTAFVHAVPSSGSSLEERLVELRDFNPNELYKDIVADGSWATKVMHELGFPNTYTFTKAIAEHLVVRACAASKMHVRIVRPSIIAPAWAVPSAGWCGEKPSGSPIVAAALLMQRRALRFFGTSDHPIPLVPVDLVSDCIVRATFAARRGQEPLIMHATVDSSEAERIPSFRTFTKTGLRIAALTGAMSLAEAGFLMHLLCKFTTESSFWAIHTGLNVFPSMLLTLICTVCEKVASWLPGYTPDDWKPLRSAARTLSKFCHLPAQYLPFSSPRSAWRFSSSLRLPKDWDSLEYSIMVYRAADVFANKALGQTKPSSVPAYSEVCVNPSRPSLLDFLVIFSTPGAPLSVCASAFLVRRVMSWMDLTVTIDAPSLVGVTKVAMPLVLCPTHRSLLDFVIIGAACFQLHPILPKMQLPHVAADAEFAGLPFLGRLLQALGAFFVRRGGGGVQPDPALRAEVGRIFRNGRPIEVFLEGLRSRGRRHLRLRTGFLRALRDVAQRNVALVPVALSYELLPEDQTFYEELRGDPRPPLQTFALVKWAVRGMRGELPSHGAAHVKLGRARVLDTDSDLPELLSEVQQQLVDLTCLTDLHARALAELLDVSAAEVQTCFAELGVSMRDSCLRGGVPLSEAEKWPLILQAGSALRTKLPSKWASWFVEPVMQASFGAVDAGDELGAATCGHAEFDLDYGLSCEVEDVQMPADSIKQEPSSDAFAKVLSAFSSCLRSAEEVAHAEAVALRKSGLLQLTEEHLFQQLLKSHHDRPSLPVPLARGAAHIVSASWLPMDACSNEPGDAPREAPLVMPLWPASHAAPTNRSNEAALDRWGYKDTKFVAQWVDGRPAVQITSNRYGSLGQRPLHKLWGFFQNELAMKMSVRDTLPERPSLPELPPPAQSLQRLSDILPENRIRTDAAARIRAGTGHGLADIWRLRTGDLLRMPDAVVRPESEDEVLKLLQSASGSDGHGGFAVIPVGGRTNVTSALNCPPKEVDSRPFVALDMTGLSSVKWVKKEDGVALIEAGITGMALKEALRAEGVNMGMEPDSMEFSTLGGWIATRASGMKRARYGNIEDMVVEVRVVTPSGVLWQHHGEVASSTGEPTTAFGRASTNVGLPGLFLGSEGCLGVVVAAVVRVRPLPEVVEYQSIVFPGWQQGAQWMREVARLPAALRPASARLMDSKQLQLASAIKEDPTKGALRGLLQNAYLQLRGVAIENAAAVTLVFEGSKDEVWVQKRALTKLLKGTGGLWGGAASGEAGYALTFAIAYLRDFGLDYQILSESLETLAPWSVVHKVWPAVVAAVEAEHSKLRLPGRPFLSCRMTQLYDEGGVLYMYLAICTAGLSSDKALEAFHCLEAAARKAVMKEGGCLSHHHGVGKHRASLLGSTQPPATTGAMQGLKAAVDPENILGARNGAWTDAATHQH